MAPLSVVLSGINATRTASEGLSADGLIFGLVRRDYGSSGLVPYPIQRGIVPHRRPGDSFMVDNPDALPIPAPPGDARTKTPPSIPTDLARRLWAHALGDDATPEAVAWAAERTCAELRVGLRRWIGADGYRSLLERSLAQVRQTHPSFEAMSCLGEDDSEMTAAVREHGAEQVATGLLALMTALIEVLGRILGDDMAAQLVEKAVNRHHSNDVNTASPGDIDG